MSFHPYLMQAGYMKKKSFWDKPLQYKISLMTLLVAAVPFVIFFATMAVIYSRAYETRNNQQLKEDLQVMSDRVEKIFDDTVLCTNYITLTFNSIFDEPVRHQVDADNSIKSVLNQSLLIFDGIESLVYISEGGIMYSTKYDLYSHEDSIKSSEYMNTLKNKKNGTTILFDVESDCMITADNDNVITMGKRIVHIKSGATLGFLLVNIDASYLEKSMENTITTYYLFDSKGKSVSDKRDDVSVELSTIKSNRKNLVLEGAIPEYEWKIVGVTDLAVYNISFTQLIPIVVAVIIITFLLLILLSLVLTRMITKPLKELENGAQEIAKGNLEVSFDFDTNDEIGSLARIFNHMTKEIAGLFKQVDEEARKRTTYELALVQEQVKPHFLYNTLDIIIMLIEMNKPREASRVTRKLADYYKSSLSSSADIVTIEKELRIIEDYLDLQLMRYKDKFTYNITMDDSLSNVLLPKMTLQPLVENAIYHGLKYKEGWGTIDINVTSEKEKAIIKVSDDGVGMDGETLEVMLKNKDNPEEHFGVYSVVHRLKLYYGDQCNVDVISNVGEGTTFIISIPVNWEGKNQC